MPPVSSNPAIAQNNLSSMGSPFSQQRQGQTPFINNASQSPFHTPSSNTTTPNLPSGFNAPSFGGGGTFSNNSQNTLVQSNDKLVQALSKLTQVLSAGGRAGGGAVGGAVSGINPTPTTANPTANTQTTTPATAQNQTGSGAVSNPIAQGGGGFGGGGGGGFANTAVRVAGAALRGFGQAGSATSAADLISMIPGVGPMLAAPYKIAGGMAGGIASLQAANKQRMLSAGVFGDVGVGQNADLNAFAKLGIDPNEAIGMQMQAQNAGFGRFSTQGEGALANLPMGMNLSRLAGLGFSGGTAGMFQGIGAALNPNALNRNGLFSAGFNLGFNDVQMQGLAGGVLGLQRNLFNQNGGGMNRSSFDAMVAASTGSGAFLVESLQNQFRGAGNMVQSGSPFGDLGARMIDLEVQRQAPGDYYQQEKLKEDLRKDPRRVFNTLMKQVGGDSQLAKTIMKSVNPDMSTADIDNLAMASQMSESAISGITGKAQAEVDRINQLQFGKGAQGSAVNVAAQQAQYAIDNVTKFSDQVSKVLEQDRIIQTDKLDPKNFKPEEAAEALKKMSEATTKANEIMFDVMKKINNLIDKIDKKGFGTVISEAISAGFDKVVEKIKNIKLF